jgi:hypothetical protein
MPHIPIPPMTSYMNTKMTTQQMLQKIQQINAGNIYNTPSQMDAQQIADIAIQQAKIALDELLKLEQEKRKQTILTIENIDKIVGQNYCEGIRVAGVKEWDDHYEFTLLGTGSSNQVETILLHRRQTSDKRYIMEYNNQTLWVSKDRLSTITGIIECMNEI